jgi:hypothetical protein
MKWYKLLWSVLVTYVCAYAFAAYIGPHPVTIATVFWFLVAFGVLQEVLGAIEKMVRDRWHKKAAVAEVFAFLNKYAFPRLDNPHLKQAWMPSYKAEEYFREISNWLKRWNWSSGKPLPEYILAARDWVAQYARLFKLIDNGDAYGVDRFAEISDLALERYLGTYED